ncbi:REP-associated tyrosine transposase [Thiohalomonas denitrificans]|uniref:REP-associated tyrosine transposase n=1 Tax=Thiohalomonas denitrificans TaxID=415747 RepID=UPI0026EE64ED|nr:transposase [Thiohalomonas denitrificans]
MTNYRRNRVMGGTYFFTVNLYDRTSRLLIDEIDRFRAAVRYARHNHPFRIDAWVVLPEHMHAVWTLPTGDADFATRWSLIKATFSRSIPKRETVSVSRAGKEERGIWQRRYWEHTIRDEEDFRRCVDYVHINPLKHDWVKRVADWPFSTFHQHVRQGSYPPDWGTDTDVKGDFGERQ